MSLKKILKGFEKTIKDLDRLISTHEGRMIANQQTIDVIQAETITLSREAVRAALVADKLKGLIEVE